MMERKIPVRRCTGCGEHFPKNTLIRVLRTPEGDVVLDLVGKRSGRGAYICPRKTCFARARKSKRIENVLECQIPDSIYDEMQERIESEAE